MAAPSKKHVSVQFRGDEEVLQHISNIHERKSSLRSAKTPKSHKSVSYAEENAENEGVDEEEVFKPSDVLTVDDDIAGCEVFGFKTPKKSGQMAQKAAESAQATTPKTPKTPKSASKRTPGKSRGGATTPLAKKCLTGSSKVRQLEATTPYRFRKRNAEEDLSEDDSDSDVEVDGSDADSIASSEHSEHIPDTPTAKSRSSKKKDRGEQEIKAVQSDDYFHSQSQAGLTSDRTLARLETPRMDQVALQDALKDIQVSYTRERQALIDEHTELFDKWMLEMCNGYNLLLHGLGSKRNLLEDFRDTMLKDLSHIVINGYFPSITIKHILNAITEELLDHSGNFRNPIEQCEFIKHHYESNDYEDLYLVIHNIDGAMMRSEKVQVILSMLGQIQGVHILASIDHINAPLIWDQQKSSKFNWLWHDATTYALYREETSYENSLLVQQSGVLALSSMTHVMRSLTPNARGIFFLLVKVQLDHKDNSNYAGMPFHDLYQKCREAFLVNSDLTLRAQLTEFRDHKLIRSKKGLDGVELLLIPLDSATLQEFLEQQDEA